MVPGRCAEDDRGRRPARISDGPPSDGGTMSAGPTGDRSGRRGREVAGALVEHRAGFNPRPRAGGDKMRGNCPQKGKSGPGSVPGNSLMTRLPPGEAGAGVRRSHRPKTRTAVFSAPIFRPLSAQFHVVQNSRTLVDLRHDRAAPGSVAGAGGVREPRRWESLTSGGGFISRNTQGLTPPRPGGRTTKGLGG